MSILRIRRLLPVGVLLAFAVAQGAAAAGANLWRDSPGRALATNAPRPAAYRSLSVDFAELRSVLADAAARGEALSVPRPNGGFSDFVLSDSGTLPPELAAKYPEIRSYRGSDKDGNRIRLDVSPLGINAMVFSHDGVWMVRPETYGTGSSYLSYRRADVVTPGEFRCGVHGEPDVVGLNLVTPPAQLQVTTGAVRRNYRAAVAANHDYVAKFGTTVAEGLAAVVITVNRVNEVYENDFSIHMTLVPNNDLIVYPDAGTDPYSNDTNAVDENTPNLNAVLGDAAYDIGHVFTTGSGGVAQLGVVCRTSKGRGTTGSPSPSTDDFDIDYVAHEMGHQFGGDHTFNGTASNCGGGNRSGSSAYEPGSGSTIMAYAGICGVSNNLQPHSDPYFHAKSLDQMGAYSSNASTGGSCSVDTPNPNAAPAVAPLTNRVIPANTPFELTGSATTNSDGALTYGWEEYDLGAANNNLNNDPGTGPIIRSINPSTSTTRTIPSLANLIAGTNLKGELLPTKNRAAMKFRLTVRDNASDGGTTASADLSIQVVATANNTTFGPFKVTAPDTAVNWIGNTTETVTWDVANTDLTPVSCSQVRLTVSLDGGLTYPEDLGVYPNTGLADIMVPNVATTHARVRASCEGNIFFNISKPDFTIVEGEPIIDLIFADNFESAEPPLCEGQPLLDSSFEATTASGNANPNWSSTVAPQGGTVFYSVDDDSNAHTGTFSAWFGGRGTVQGGTETHTASQTIVIPAGDERWLNFWRAVDATGATGASSVTYTIDGSLLRTDTIESDFVEDWTQQSIDVSSYADGAEHTLIITYQYDDQDPAGSDANVFIDDVTIDCTQALPQEPRPASAMHGLHRKH